MSPLSPEKSKMLFNVKISSFGFAIDSKKQYKEFITIFTYNDNAQYS